MEDDSVLACKLYTVFSNSYYLSPKRTFEYMINFDLILILL